MKSATLLNGLRIAYQEWGVSSSQKKVLALHGWLDNSNSFNFLGRFLAENDYHVVAMDHVGHGRSDHLGLGAFYSILNTTAIAREFTNQLGWNSDNSYNLIGHSMGASISMIYASIYHENVTRLVLMEGFGPLTEKDPHMTPHNLRRAIDAEISMKQRKIKGKPYPSLKDAILERIRTVKKYPGNQYISFAAAAQIVARSVKLADSENFPGYSDILNQELGPVQFTHDPRLLLPSYIYHTDDQV